MHIKTKDIVKFRDTFTNYQSQIKDFKGCMQHDIFCDKEKEEIYYSYTIWDSEKNLNKYRKSTLLKEINTNIIQYCSKDPQAWTIDKEIEQ